MKKILSYFTHGQDTQESWLNTFSSLREETFWILFRKNLIAMTTMW